MKKIIFTVAIAISMCLAILPTQTYAMGETNATISVGGGHTMIIMQDGSLWACGWNYSGQFGNGESNRLRPQHLEKIKDNVKLVSTGDSHTFIIMQDNSLWGCGDNQHSELGDGTSEERLSFVKIMENVKEVSTHLDYSLIVKNDGSLYQCGYKKAGYNDWQTQASPIWVMDNVKTVSAGSNHSLIIKEDNSLWAYGVNNMSQLGDGTKNDSYTPIKIMENVQAVSAGMSQTFIIKTDGTLWACGANYFGELGTGKTDDEMNAPVKIMDGVKYAEISSNHSVIVKKDGSLWTCGNNARGELGDGTKANRLTPIKVVESSVVMASIGGNGEYLLTLFLKEDGSLWAFGSNSNLQFGNNSREDSLKPIKIMDGVKLPNGATIPPAPETPSAWAAESVTAAIAAGIVPEALQSKYTTATTRAEFCALAVALYETATGKTITERKTFDDTKDVNVEKAAAIGVVSGVGDNKFSPNAKLTREQAATILSRLADAIGKPLTAQAPTFADNANVSSWAFDAVGQMQATGIMGGVGNNTFSPATDYTREQSIITIMRLYNIVK